MKNKNETKETWPNPGFFLLGLQIKVIVNRRG